MTNATDGAAEAARFLKPNLADEQVVKKVRSSLKNQRDCGAASAVGAATVAISLLIGSGNVALDAFYVLLAGQVMLVYAAQYFTSRAALSLDRDVPKLVVGAFLITTTVITGAGYFLVSELKRHESNVGSTSWWLLLGVAGVGGVLGLIIRRSAESLLDELDDESWRQRVAPLVDKQQEAIANMWAFEIRLRSVLENEPQGQSSS